MPKTCILLDIDARKSPKKSIIYPRLTDRFLSARSQVRFLPGAPFVAIPKDAPHCKRAYAFINFAPVIVCYAAL